MVSPTLARSDANGHCINYERHYCEREHNDLRHLLNITADNVTLDCAGTQSPDQTGFGVSQRSGKT